MAALPSISFSSSSDNHQFFQTLIAIEMIAVATIEATETSTRSRSQKKSNLQLETLTP
ncbi:hypothetical protein DY000_02051712 [Brassica cretica]|uniref:Uncharacterized protein n=1 Tax=Brassica cretica TaxID=69181 RepID=A0ABQ7F2P4_BRACR|nr:hypothetical protein DY000_02051712 [Brassica cretica]